MKRKVIGMLIVMIIGSLFSFSAIAMTRSEFNAKLDNLRQTYYHGKQQSTYEEGSTCFGYAYMIAKSVFGTSARTWATAYDLNNVKPGDVVQYGNTTGNGHTIFVTNVSGDTITYTDCNSDYEATIKWNQTVSKSSGKIWSYAFSYRKVAPNLESDKPKDTEPPTISDVTFQRTPDGYIVSCRATDNISIKRVLFPTWTAQNGQDDLDTQWDAENSSFEGTRNGDYYTYRVRMSDHNNEEGIYYTHIYAYDSYGNNTSSSITINVYKDTEAPVIKNVKVSEKDGSGYTVTCDVSDNKKIEKVQFPTWTAQGGQDDLNDDWDTSSKYSGTIRNNKVKFLLGISLESLGSKDIPHSSNFRKGRLLWKTSCSKTLQSSHLSAPPRSGRTAACWPIPSRRRTGKTTAIRQTSTSATRRPGPPVRWVTPARTALSSGTMPTRCWCVPNTMRPTNQSPTTRKRLTTAYASAPAKRPRPLTSPAR